MKAPHLSPHQYDSGTDLQPGEGVHPARLQALNNEDIIEAFTEAQPRQLAFKRICQDNNNDFNESEGSICSSFFTFIMLLTMYIVPRLFLYFC